MTAISIVQEEALKKYIIPLSKEEFDLLEQNILKDGCLDPLKLWANEKGQYVLVDGHNRLKICEKHGLDFKTEFIKFDNIEDAKIWMANNQLGRRNLTQDQVSYYRGLKYESLKKNNKGYHQVKSAGQNEPWTYEILAQEYNVSASTIKRDAKFAKALDRIGRTNPELKYDILSGTTKVKKGDVMLFADVDPNQKLTFKNEADLHNKANRLRNKMLTEIEGQFKQSEVDRIERAREDLKASDPMFNTKDSRVSRIKGQILSAMNKAIQHNDLTAFKELEELIKKLHSVLFAV
ncbi:ParB N-terminal domain-containing protein [Fulvivirgaceae bacterium BMA12]|uniref:ParB N-terminal domain-containing protein n=1 Tax=Agaribacillus aureus TaxID=3051825 RepID=A0ABT8L616_9BACT|nr:ParB N-terminal domain-containing protein [Fulvivirgaceae bacterium BMA12]